MSQQKLALIGVPTDVGAGERGGSMGPEALRVAGIEQALRSLGHEVEDRGNLLGPTNPMQKPDNGLKHLPEVVAWNEAVRDAIYSVLKEGLFPVMLGGDHSLAIGSIAAVSKFCEEKSRPLSVIWLDAHADFNTADTSPSGNIHGMPAAILTGVGHPDLLKIGHKKPLVDPNRFVQVGIRSVDADEKVQVNKSGITVYDMRLIDELSMRTAVEKALEQVKRDDGHLHVSFDVDFLDPTIAPGVATTVAGGPNYREAQLCMEMIYDSGLLRSLDIVELNPAFDLNNRTAELAVELVESLFGKQILRRPKPV